MKDVIFERAASLRAYLQFVKHEARAVNQAFALIAAMFERRVSSTVEIWSACASPSQYSTPMQQLYIKKCARIEEPVSPSKASIYRSWKRKENGRTRAKGECA